MTIKVGIDASALHRPQSGIGVYLAVLLEELIKGLPHCQFILYVFSEEGIVDTFSSYPHVHLCIASPLSFHHGLWCQTLLSFLAWRDRLDFFWGPAQSIPLMKRTGMRTLMSVHDFAYLICPKTVSTFKCLYLKTFSKVLLKKADYLFPNSLATAERLRTFYDLPSHAVIHPPLKPTVRPQGKERLTLFLKQKTLTFNDYAVTVGTLEPRKNLATLLKLYSEILQQRGKEPVTPLVIIASPGWKDKALTKALASM
ncbi:MAG: hypothetical protein ACM3JI_02865, partial [Anaerolineae bacterium]